MSLAPSRSSYKYPPRLDPFHPAPLVSAVCREGRHRGSMSPGNRCCWFSPSFTPFSCLVEGRGEHDRGERQESGRKGGEERSESKGRWKITSQSFYRSSLTSGYSLGVSRRTKAPVPQFEEHHHIATRVRPAFKVKSWMK